MNPRGVVKALFYLSRTGCQWRYLPHDSPDWSHVYYYFRTWADAGTLERINTALRREVRLAAGCDAEPSAGVLDSQSVTSTEHTDPAAVGYDAGKGGKSRTRHLRVDTLGVLVVTSASVVERDGAAAGPGRA